jgi:hypothetical protein
MAVKIPKFSFLPKSFKVEPDSGLEIVTVERQYKETKPKDPKDGWTASAEKIACDLIMPTANNAGVLAYAALYTEHGPKHESSVDGPTFIAECVRDAISVGSSRILTLSEMDPSVRLLPPVVRAKFVNKAAMAAKRFEVWTLANPNKMPNPEELAAIYGGVS